jgi:hypothetical protein
MCGAPEQIIGAVVDKMVKVAAKVDVDVKR